MTIIDLSAPTATAHTQAVDSTHVENPLAHLGEVVIPKGTIIQTMEPGVLAKRAGRTYKVKVRSSFYGYVDMVENVGQAQFPTITWIGRGGHWHDAQVTAEMAAANGVQLANFSTTAEQAQLLGLPHQPSWSGATNKWAAGTD